MIHANQFSNNKCDRLLLVHDDLAGKGLGWSVRFWNTALLAALQSNRMLHEEAASDVQSEMTEAKKNTSKLTNRWCDVPPYTLECFYKRWNSCEAIPSHRGLKLTWHKRGHSWGHGLSATSSTPRCRPFAVSRDALSTLSRVARRVPARCALASSLAPLVAAATPTS